MALKTTTVQTGVYPTDTPATLTSAVAIARVGSSKSLDVLLKVSAGAATDVNFLGWVATFSGGAWLPIGTVNTAFAVTGGFALGRFTPGTNFSHFLLWETAGVLTITTAGFNQDTKR